MALLFCSHNLDSARNMALDEVLWNESAQGGGLFMRLYSWSDRPALSLGYFQDLAAVRRDVGLARLPYVRRLTGGGAIVHDDEITYSLAIPAALAPGTELLYDRVHKAFASRLADIGIPATVDSDDSIRQSEAALCFARTDPFAVRVSGVKVLGSAQRRRPDSVLMHGSLILRRSGAAPDVAGLADLIDSVPDRNRLEQALEDAAERALELRFNRTAIPAELLIKADRLAETKYRSDDWNIHRARRFSRKA